ncbi:MAG: serine/threonine-protein kinase [Prosthecobacter sp.]
MTEASFMEDLDATVPVPSPTPRGAGGAGVGERLSESNIQGLFDAIPETRSMNARKWSPPSPEQIQQALPQYEITGFIARGGMGAVYRGIQRSLRRTVAIKVLPPEIEEGEMQYSERFKREAQSMAQLTHPNIVAVYDAGETPEGLLYFVMEYIEGTDLAQLITTEGSIPPARALSITATVCGALAFAHGKDIIHRDIKPSNIMLDKDGQVKVADFGLAKTIHAESTLLTGSHITMGTADFIAPEALIPGTPVDGRADVYAVGVMLYQMLTGRVPRGRFAMPSVVVPAIDTRLDFIVDKAMQSDPAQRYPTAQALRSAVEAAATSKLPLKSLWPRLLGFISLAVVLASGFVFWPQPQALVSVPKAEPEMPTAAAETWKDVIAELTLDGDVERTEAGLLFTDVGFATYIMNQDSKQDGAVRMSATFGSMNPALRARVSAIHGVYEISVKSQNRIELCCYDAAAKSLKTLREFPLTAPLTAGQNYELELRVVGQTLTAKLNGSALGTVTDSTLEEGHFGVGVSDYNGTPTLVKAIEALDLDAP